MNFLNLIRWKNLCMIALAQLLIKYALLEPLGVNTSLNVLGIIILIMATTCIAAAGNIINDLYDIDTDTINKPHKLIINKFLSEQAAFNGFIIFNLLGVGLGFYVSHLVGKSAFFSVFVVSSALLYVYASYLKRLFLIGNIVISILVALSILIVGIFDLLPAVTPENQHIQLSVFKTILYYAVFAFVLNLIREIIKDMEDVDGDNKTGMHTLPIVIGFSWTRIIVFVLMLMTTISLSMYTINSLYRNPVASGYFLCFVIGPLLYSSIILINAKTKKDFNHLSHLLKLVMLFGMLSLLLYKYILL
ncbi:geranylgeranylglycerol-phosphate geranylgeranyltransferase [Aestuariivivens sediminis]|uniref:geranylgeranylglycerol-phosphate geranylgeranyltransferase n=1 Tax=Aestuariivivens sediminis TaxID=2913557 RepID=UPI001F571CF8|nr:geranylgeranylglycerol-phosphate geranylgeranyltransferase [Aestuariivivens sediminis]